LAYTIRLHPDAKRELRDLPGHVRLRFVRLIDGLAETATHASARALVGIEPGYFRIRVDAFRLVYRVEGNTVWVLRVGRKLGPELYRDLPDT